MHIIAYILIKSLKLITITKIVLRKFKCFVWFLDSSVKLIESESIVFYVNN